MSNLWKVRLIAWAFLAMALSMSILIGCASKPTEAQGYAKGEDFVLVYDQYAIRDGSTEVWLHKPTGLCFVKIRVGNGAGLTEADTRLCRQYEVR